MFTGGLFDQRGCCEHTGPLRHVTGFPGLGLLWVLRPIPAASAGNGPSRRPAGRWPGRGPPGWFPRSLWNPSTGSTPSYAPAASPRLRRRPSPWPPDWRHHPAKEFPPPKRRCALLPSPDLPGSSWWSRLERRSAAGSSRTPFRLACRTRTIWQCRPVPSLSGLLSTLPLVPGIRLPSASMRPLRRAHGGGLSPPQGSRAPRGARSRRSTAGWVRWRRTGGPRDPPDGR